MAESQENIEAKLIAFVEGDLDAAGRAEIEQHLVANPTHRKLLDELMRTRQYVRQLPRAKAPPELVETLQGQLERSALLDNIGTDAGSLQLRSNRWPQLISIAAVVLLALGLAAVVYMALPRDDDRQTIARNTDDDTATATRPVARATRPAEPSISTITVAPPEEAIATAEVPGTAESDAMIAPSAKPSVPVTPDVVEMAAKQDSTAPVATGPRADMAPLAAAPGAASSSTLPTAVEVASANEPDLQRQLAQAPMQLEPQAYDEAFYVVVNAADPAKANARVASYLSQNRIDHQNVVPNVMALNARDSQRAAAGIMAPYSADSASMQFGTTRQSTQGGYADSASPDQQQLSPSAPAPREQRQAALAEAQVTQQIFAKRMTRLQVSELQTAIAEPDVALIEPPPAPADALQPGDEVEITVNELVGPGVEKTNRARVAADGNVIMPMVEPVRAQGLTPDRLSDAVAQRYKDSSLIEQPTVTVARVTSAFPATSPAATPAASSVATTAPATTAPATQAVARTEVDADAPVDVMIVVQAVAPVIPLATTAPATRPATQPATAPATQTTTQPAVLPATAPASVPARPLSAEPVPATLPAATQPMDDPVLEGIMP